MTAPLMAGRELDALVEAALVWDAAADAINDGRATNETYHEYLGAMSQLQWAAKRYRAQVPAMLEPSADHVCTEACPWFCHGCHGDGWLKVQADATHWRWGDRCTLCDGQGRNPVLKARANAVAQ